MCPESIAEPRKASAPEVKLLRRLLSGEFPGAAALRTQLANLFVEPIDAEGSLRLRPYGPTPACVSRRIPVEASYNDVDGVVVHLLIHVIDGVLDELEIYREDSATVMLPPVDALDVSTAP